MSCNLPMLQTGIFFFTGGLSLLLAAFINLQILTKVEKENQFTEKQVLREKIIESNIASRSKKKKMELDFSV